MFLSNWNSVRTAPGSRDGFPSLALVNPGRGTKLQRLKHLFLVVCHSGTWSDEACGVLVDCEHAFTAKVILVDDFLRRVLCSLTCCTSPIRAVLKRPSCRLLRPRLRGALRALQALWATGETANRQQKVSNPPPEANLAVGFLVLAHSRRAPAEFKGAMVMYRKVKQGAGSAWFRSTGQANRCGGVA